MIWCVLVIVFFATVVTGPAGLEWLEHRRDTRRALADRPRARVTYLPSEACRTQNENPAQRQLASGVPEANDGGG